MNLIQVNEILKSFGCSVKNFDKKCGFSIYMGKKEINSEIYPNKKVLLNPDDKFWGTWVLELVIYGILSNINEKLYNKDQLTKDELEIKKSFGQNREKVNKRIRLLIL